MSFVGILLELLAERGQVKKFSRRLNTRVVKNITDDYTSAMASHYVEL